MGALKRPRIGDGSLAGGGLREGCHECGSVAADEADAVEAHDDEAREGGPEEVALKLRLLPRAVALRMSMQ